jgi:hypothetical protein
MKELSLDIIDNYLNKEGDWTIRLLNKNLSSPRKYIFALLRFDGERNIWTVKFQQQNRIVSFEEDGKDYLEAKQLLMQKIPDYLQTGYKITVVASGYYIPPSLQRKR